MGIEWLLDADQFGSPQGGESKGPRNGGHRDTTILSWFTMVTIATSYTGILAGHIPWGLYNQLVSWLLPMVVNRCHVAQLSMNDTVIFPAPDFCCTCDDSPKL